MTDFSTGADIGQTGNAGEPRRTRLAGVFFSYREHRLRAAWRLALQSALFFVLAVLLIPLLFSIGAPLGIRAGIPLLLETQLSTTLAATLSIYLARRLLDRRSFASLGLRTDRHGLPDFLFGFALLGGLTAVMAVVGGSLGWFTFESIAWQAQPPASVVMSLLVSLFILATVAWTEELFYRGYWLQNMAEGWSPLAALILTSLLFPLVHPNLELIDWLHLTAAGLLLGYAYLRSRRLWLPIGLHLGWNFVGLSILGLLGPFPYDVGLAPVIDIASHSPLVAGVVPARSLMAFPVLGLAALGVYFFTKGRP